MCQITYARIQGRQALVDHFMRSKLPCTEPEYLPVMVEWRPNEENVVIVDGKPPPKHLPLYTFLLVRPRDPLPHRSLNASHMHETGEYYLMREWMVETNSLLPPTRSQILNPSPLT